MFWSKCLDDVFTSALVAHFACELNCALSRPCVFILSWLSVLVPPFLYGYISLQYEKGPYFLNDGDILKTRGPKVL